MKFEIKSAVSIIGALVIVAFVSAACSKGPAAGGDQAVLKVGDQRGAIHALLQASGELKDVPYKIEWANLPAAAPLLEALSAGAIDIGPTGVAPFAFAYGNGAQVRAVMASRIIDLGPQAGRGIAIIVPKGSSIRSLADLKGKRLATVKGSVGHDTALKLLERAGIDAKSVQFVYLNNGDAKAALGAGSIDAWATWAPYVAIAVLENGDRILADGQEVMSKGAGFHVASTKALQTKKPLIRDFLQRYIRAAAWGRVHKPELAAEVAKETGVSVAVARYGLETGSVTSLTPITPDLIDEQRAIFERFLHAGVIDKMPVLDAGGYDASFNDIIAPETAPVASPKS